MALIICSKCGKQMSDRAPMCPHCGNVINVNSSERYEPGDDVAGNTKYRRNINSRNTEAWLYVLLTAILVLLALGAFFVFLRLSSGGQPAVAAEEVVQPAVEATELSSNRSPGDGHYSMTGRLADLPIEMQFTISGRYVNGTLIYTGISLTSVEDGLEIYGEIDGDNLVLNEINERGERSGNFVGTMRDGRYTGTFHRYRNGRNDKDFSFYLHQ